ncbi:MAG: hypothetical protein ABSH41_23760, partial [Syntrophobacteraceae bacterium]
LTENLKLRQQELIKNLKQQALADKLRQRELIANLKSEYQARADVKKLIGKINKIAGAGTTSALVQEGGKAQRIQAEIPLDYRKQIAQILQSVGWKGFEKVNIEDPEPLMEFIERKFDEGEVYESNFPDLQMMAGKGISGLSLEALHDLHDCLNEIFHKAKTSGILQTTANRKAVQDAATEMAHRMMEYHNPIMLPKGAENALVPYDEREGAARRLLGKIRGYNIANLEVETLLEWMDGWTKNFGPNWTYGYKPINDGSTKVYELEKRSAEFAKILGRFSTGVKGLGPWAEEKFSFPELGGKFLRKNQMMAFALHYGNQGNRDALKNSFKVPDHRDIPQSLTDAQVWAVISRLTPEEWQAVIDTVKLWNNPETREQLGSTYLENTGNEFPFLKLGKVTVPHLGEVDEWHAAMIDDRDASFEMERRRAKDETRDLFARTYRPQSPQNGSTKTRLAGARHILDLDFISTVAQFLADQNRYIGLTIPLRDVQKVFNNPAFRMATENYLGKDYYKMFSPWLQDKARPQSELVTQPVRMLSKLRRNGVMMHIGLKPWTAVKHLSQLLMLSESVTGPRVMAAALSPRNGVLLRPWTARRIIEQDNPYMQALFEKWDRDLAQFYTNYDPARWEIRNKFNSVMLSGIEIMVNFLGRVGWMAEYNRWMGDPENRGNVEIAREHANKVVRDNLGSYDPKDLSAMRRGSELDKMLTSFMTVPAALYQKFFRMATQFAGPNQGNSWERIFRFTRSAMYVLVALAAIDAFFEKRRIPDAIDFARSFPLTVANAFPVWRDVIGAFLNGHEYQLSFVGDAFKSIIEAGKHLTGIAKGAESWNKYAFEQSMSALGYWTGYPTDQTTTTAEGLYNWGEPGYEPWNVIIKPPAKEVGPRRRGRK